MEKLVSVIIPAYNAGKTIDRCLDSLLNQSLDSIEIIVINDCSKDDTYEHLKKYKDKIVLINNRVNSGPAKSRNKGLKRAQGKYIGFVDADDYVAHNMYEEMVHAFDDDVDLVCCGRTNITKDGFKEIINQNETDDPHLFSKTSNYIWDKLFKKSVIDEYKIKFPEDYSYAEDFSFLIRYKFYAKKMKILKKTLYFYNDISENSITNSYKMNTLDIISVLEDTLDFFRDKEAFSKYEKELLDISVGFYVRRIREFKRYNDPVLQREFVYRFMVYFKKNFKRYRYRIATFSGKKFLFYRSFYCSMVVYIALQRVRRMFNGSV